MTRLSGPLVVLITNNTLDVHAGSECYARDVARFLLRRGHTVVAYSTQLGAVAAEMSNMGVVVVNDLASLEVKPDVIHGQHHLDIACAILRYPGVPVISFIHGLLPWEELPLPDLSCIYTYVVVSQFVRESLLAKGILSSERIKTIPNFADSSVFQRMRDLGVAKDRTRLKILIYGNYRPKELDSIISASQVVSADIDMLGLWSPAGNQSNPELFLPKYDVVFAYGRSAVEALFCGCEVILAHSTGTGGLIEDENFLSYRSRNFGFSCCQGEQGVAGIEAILERVNNARMTGQSILSAKYRASLDSEQYLCQIESLYYDACSRHLSQGPAIDQYLYDSQLLSGYLRVVKHKYVQMKSDLESSRADAELAREEAERARQEAGRARVDADVAREEAEHARQDADHAKAEAHSIRSSRLWRLTWPIRWGLSWLKTIF